jgi:protein O-mannosyl-transferase
MTKNRNRKEPIERSEYLEAETARDFPRKRSWQLYAIAAVLIVMTLMAFWGTQRHSFVSMDDDVYVTDNARVQSGLSWENVKWAFSTTYFGYYYPLTWLSHMLDCQLFGTWAGGHHLTSLIIHILNVLLLFAVLMRMTGFMWRSFSVAALFAVHPLHVESVAWVAERKDVLSTFFWFLCLLAYAWYVENPSFRRYSLIFLAFLLGLMSKPMIITLPFVLLLLDYWPLGRWSPFKDGVQAEKGERKPPSLYRLIWEKIPLFLLVAVFSVLTLIAQKQLGAVVDFKSIPIVQRLANALISYAGYLKMMVIPINLAAYYPLPQAGVSIGAALLCGLGLFILTAAALWYGRWKRYLAVGWLWYLGTLIPVIGLVQIGEQSMADRYTYVSLVGIFMTSVWGIAELAEQSAKARKAVAESAGIIMAVLIILTRAQVHYWSDSNTLFEHTLAVTSDNWLVHNGLGDILFKQGKKEEAKAHFVESLRINPRFDIAQSNLATCLAKEGNNAGAIEHFEQALKFKPGSAKTMNELGLLLAHEKRLPEAIEYFKKSVQLDPGSCDSRSNLGYALLLSGQLDASIAQYREAVKLSPSSANAVNGLGMALMKAGRLSEASARFEEALKIDPGFGEARNNLATVLIKTGNPEEAIDKCREAVRLDPNSAEACSNLGLALMQAGDLTEAAAQFEEATRLSPGYENAYINLGVVLARQKRFAEAEECFKKALKINPRSEVARSNLDNAQRVLREKSK